jgi:hypothetical protein
MTARIPRRRGPVVRHRRRRFGRGAVQGSPTVSAPALAPGRVGCRRHRPCRATSKRSTPGAGTLRRHRFRKMTILDPDDEQKAIDLIYRAVVGRVARSVTPAWANMFVPCGYRSSHAVSGHRLKSPVIGGSLRRCETFCTPENLACRNSKFADPSVVRRTEWSRQSPSL